VSGVDLAYGFGLVVLAAVFAPELRSGWGVPFDFLTAFIFFLIVLAVPAYGLERLGRRLARPYLKVCVPAIVLAWLVYLTTMYSMFNALLTLALACSGPVVLAGGLRGLRAWQADPPAAATTAAVVDLGAIGRRGMVVLAVAVNVCAIVFLLLPGFPGYASTIDVGRSPLGTLDALTDPSRAGPLAVETLTYGSEITAPMSTCAPTRSTDARSCRAGPAIRSARARATGASMPAICR
jgi:hypothetical protein